MRNKTIGLVGYKKKEISSFKKRGLRKLNSMRTRRLKRMFNKSRSIRPKLKRRKTVTHSKKSRKLVRQSTV